MGRISQVDGAVSRMFMSQQIVFNGLMCYSSGDIENNTRVTLTVRRYVFQPDPDKEETKRMPQAQERAIEGTGNLQIKFLSYAIFVPSIHKTWWPPPGYPRSDRSESAKATGGGQKGSEWTRSCAGNQHSNLLRPRRIIPRNFSDDPVGQFQSLVPYRAQSMLVTRCSKNPVTQLEQGSLLVTAASSLEARCEKVRDHGGARRVSQDGAARDRPLQGLIEPGGQVHQSKTRPTFRWLVPLRMRDNPIAASQADQAANCRQVAVKLLQEGGAQSQCRRWKMPGCNRQTQRSTMMMQGTQVRGMCRKPTKESRRGKRKEKKKKASISAY